MCLCILTVHCSDFFESPRMLTGELRSQIDAIPHPGVPWPKAVEDVHAMVDGSLRIKTRAALAGYVLRRWGIDSTDDHRLDPASHHLWLRNPQTLYGVESASLAPGAFP